MSRYLSPKLVIAEAWEITRDHNKRLFWYGFIPAFFGMIVGTVYVLYQAVAFRHYFLGEKDKVNYLEIFSRAWDFIFTSQIPTWLIITVAVITLIGYVFFPVFSRGALVFLIEKIIKGEEPEKEIQTGFMRFIPLFEYSAVKNAVDPKSFFTEASFVLRNLGSGLFRLFLIPLIVFSFFGLIALFFFAYVPQIIVLQREGLMTGITRSSKLAFTYFTETLTLFLLFLLIELRVLINIIIILFLPIAVFAISGFFAAKLLTGVGIVLSVIVGLILLTFASLLSGTLEIFSVAIWTIAFHTLTPDEEKTTKL